jgi:hypothetical protein
MFLYFALTLLAINFYTLIEFFRKLLNSFIIYDMHEKSDGYNHPFFIIIL